MTITGGYAGCGAPDPDERDIVFHETVLSGDLAGDDVVVAAQDLISEPTRVENSDHVLAGIGTNESASIDGFTVVGANGSEGGGMYNENSSPTVSRCTFSGNSANKGIVTERIVTKLIEADLVIVDLHGHNGNVMYYRGSASLGRADHLPCDRSADHKWGGQGAFRILRAALEKRVRRIHGGHGHHDALGLAVELVLVHHLILAEQRDRFLVPEARQ